jgi:phosphatidylglycerophosphate synthase
LPLTAEIARPQHRDLLHSALVGLLVIALVLAVIGLLEVRLLQLSAAYMPKTLAVFAAGAVLVLLGLPTHHPFQAIGPANEVTIARGALVALLAGFIGERSDSGAPMIAAAIALAATLLDGVDGWLARRTRMASSFGARFDMETDAVMIAVLSVLTWQYGKAGAWVLLSGLLRYLFVAAAAVIPLLRHPVPSSYRGKTIAVVQMLALIVAIAPFSTVRFSSSVAAVALVALAASFLLDVVWLVRRRD